MLNTVPSCKMCVKKKNDAQEMYSFFFIVAKIKTDFSRPGLNFVHLHPCLAEKQ